MSEVTARTAVRQASVDKRRGMRVAAVLLILLGALGGVAALVACTPQVGVQAASGGAFTATVSATDGNAGLLIAQNTALSDGRAFCAQQGRRFLSIGDQIEREMLADRVTFTVRFRCPEPGSPDLPRPTVNQNLDDLL
jgi:hypothetical protein